MPKRLIVLLALVFLLGGFAIGIILDHNVTNVPLVEFKTAAAIQKEYDEFVVYSDRQLINMAISKEKSSEGMYYNGLYDACYVLLSDQNIALGAYMSSGMERSQFCISFVDYATRNDIYHMRFGLDAQPEQQEEPQSNGGALETP